MRPIIPYPTGRLLWGAAFPGTSCQATIVLSLRDTLADISPPHPANLLRMSPEGRSKSLSVPEIFVVETDFMWLWKRRIFLLKGMLASSLSRNPFNRPAGTGPFSS